MIKKLSQKNLISCNQYYNAAVLEKRHIDKHNGEKKKTTAQTVVNFVLHCLIGRGGGGNLASGQLYTGEASTICTSFTRLGSASKSLFLTLLGLGLATQANGLKIKGYCEITVHNPVLVYVLKLLPAQRIKVISHKKQPVDRKSIPEGFYKLGGKPWKENAAFFKTNLD